MAIPNISQIGQSGLKAAKAGISTAGHNIANASTEGYSRQRVVTEANVAAAKAFGNNVLGTGTDVARVERLNDDFIEKQIRNSNRELAHFEEKQVTLSQIEDVFNEMGSEGLNRLMGQFFNQFRQLSNQPESASLRSAIRDAGQSLVNEFHRMEKQLSGIRRNLDDRIESFANEANVLAKEIAELNERIQLVETTGALPNDLLDKRDLALKKLSAFADVTAHKDSNGAMIVEMKGVGPWITSNRYETLSTLRVPIDAQGNYGTKVDLVSSGSVQNSILSQIRGGKIGAMIETRDQVLASAMDQLDQLASGIVEAVNSVHSQGFNLEGKTGLAFFKPLEQRGAAGRIELSELIRSDADLIATAAEPDAPGDNRIALAIAGLHSQKLIGDLGQTADEWYGSIIHEVGSQASHNQFALNREKDVVTQLNRVRDQISGVSVDEETTHLMEFQHAFEASAKVIQVADEILKTVLALKRD